MPPSSASTLPWDQHHSHHQDPAAAAAALHVLLPLLQPQQTRPALLRHRPSSASMLSYLAEADALLLPLLHLAAAPAHLEPLSQGSTCCHLR